MPSRTPFRTVSELHTGNDISAYFQVFGAGWSARITPNPRPIEVWDTQASWPLPLEIRTDPSGPTGMLAEELRCFCRVVRGLQPVPVGATYADAIQLQHWLDKLAACAK